MAFRTVLGKLFLSDSDRQTMCACDFDAFALAERRAVPVEVVDLELHDFGFRVVSDELLELFGRAVR